MMTILTFFLIIIIIFLTYENGKLCKRQTIPWECACCRHSRMWKDLFYTEISRKKFFGESRMGTVYST